MNDRASRITVYVAPVAFVGDEFRAVTQQLVVASHPAVAKHPTMWREAGTVDDETAAMIEMLADEATLPRLWERIRLPRIDGATERDAPSTSGHHQARYNQAVAALIAEEKKPTDEAVAERLKIQPRTVVRWRHDGLIG